MNAPIASPPSVLRRAALGAVLGLAAGLVAAFATSEKWLVQAKVMLQIGPETAGSRPSMVGSPAPFLAGNPRREDVQTEVELLASSDLLRRAFERFVAADREAALGPSRGMLGSLLSGTAEAIGLVSSRTDEQRALDRWAGTLRIAAIPSSTVLAIESRSERPEAARALLRHMLDVYLEDHRQAFGSRGMPEVMRTYLAEKETALAKREEHLSTLRKQADLSDFAVEVEQLQSRRQAAAATAARLEGEAAAATAQAKELAELLAATPAELRTAREQRSNPTRDALDLRLAQARQDLATAEQQFAAGAPEVRQAKAQVDLLLGLVEAAAPVREDGVVTGRDPLHDALRDQAARARATAVGLRAELEVATTTLRAIDARLAALEGHRPELQKAELEVEEGKRDVVQARDGLRLAEIEERLDERGVANATVVAEPAWLPTPAKTFGLPTRVAVLLGCTAFGLACGLALAYWRAAAARGLPAHAN